MIKICASTVIRNNLFPNIAYLSILVFLTGCASTKVTDPREPEKTLNSEVMWDGKPTSITIIEGGLPSKIALADGEEIPEGFSLELYFYSDPKSGIQIYNRFAVRDGIVFGIDELLPEALARSGLNVARTHPNYYIVADCRINGIGGGSLGGLLILWDVVMAVPSVVLPIPLAGINEFSLEVHLYDENQVKINSRRLTNVDVSLVLYSFWSVVTGERSRNNALADAAISLVIEMIQECENKSSAEPEH